MSIYDTIGFIWVVFTAGLGTIGIFYFAWLGLTQVQRDKVRGEIENQLDIARQGENRILERMAK